MTVSRQTIAIGIGLLFLPAMISIGQKVEDRVTGDSALADLKSGNQHHVSHRYAPWLPVNQ